MIDILNIDNSKIPLSRGGAMDKCAGRGVLTAMQANTPRHPAQEVNRTARCKFLYSKFFYFLLFLFPLQLFAQTLKVTNLQCEYKADPAGIEALAPKLSWILQSDQRNIMQSAYRVLVADNAASLNKGIGNMWDSKRLNSSTSIQVTYAGKQLFPAKTYYWKVMVWDNQRHVSLWSNVAQWQMGLLNSSDWKGAKWIAYASLPDSSRIVPFLENRGPKKLPPFNDVFTLVA